jgi:hypothetical protein
MISKAAVSIYIAVATIAFCCDAIARDYIVVKEGAGRVLIYKYVGNPGGEICLYFRNHQQHPARIHLFRTAQPGGSKDLDYHIGQRCLTTKGLSYRVYGEATSEDVIVFPGKEKMNAFNWSSSW